MVRRTSSSKMYHTLTVEAPITKVIHILMSVRESSPLYIAQALDKVPKSRKLLYPSLSQLFQKGPRYHPYQFFDGLIHSWAGKRAAKKARRPGDHGFAWRTFVGKEGIFARVTHIFLIFFILLKAFFVQIPNWGFFLIAKKYESP